MRHYCKASLVALAALAALWAATGAAQARRGHHHGHHRPQSTGGALSRPEGTPYDTSRGVIGHPAGCPRVAFCGCGASVRVFGHPVRDLWLAAAWFRFPRTAPAPGAVAVRRHHVFVLESHVSGDIWIVYDANSGGRATRVHQRSIAGLAIVDPRA